MEENKDKLFSGSIGKIVSVFYNDTANSVSFKIGQLVDFDNSGILILETETSRQTLIPRDKCIRIEIGGEPSLAKSRNR